MPRITILLFDGFSNMVLSCLMEPLRALRDQAHPDLDWQIVTLAGAPARSSSGLSIAPDRAAGAAEVGEILMVVAGYGFRDHATPATRSILRRLARPARIVIGADTGAWLMAAAGFLDDQAATLHFSVLADFAETFPRVQASNARYVMAGRYWSCGGASCALDLILAFIAARFGPADAFMASTMFLHDAERQERHGRGPDHLSGPGTGALRQAVGLMVETIEAPLPLAAIAARTGLSLRGLDRLFRAELRLSPGRYYQLLRLARARELAESSDFGLREIALRCGYSGAPALSKAFRHSFGHPIRRVHVTAAQPAMT